MNELHIAPGFALTTRTFTWRVPKQGERYMADFTNGVGIATRDFTNEYWVLEREGSKTWGPPSGDRVAGVPPWQGGRLLKPGQAIT